MSEQILPNAVVVNAGDSLSTIASAVFGDTSMWRELAVYNDLNIFKAPIIGKTLKIPTQDAAKSKYASLLPSSVVKVENTVKSRVSEILNSRQATTITKILKSLGVNIDQSKILQSLDLSNLTKGLPNPSDTDLQIYRLIQWVL